MPDSEIRTFESDPKYGGLLHPDFESGVIEKTMQESVVLSNFNRIRDMQAREMWFDVRAELPTASAVDAIDEPVPSTLPAKTGKKQSTDQRFEPRIIYAGEFATWKWFYDADLEDALSNGYDVIGGDIPLFASQFGAAIDRAVIWGIGKPRQWANTPSLWQRANAAGAVVAPTDNPYVDMFGTGGVNSKIVLSGYRGNRRIVAAPEMEMVLQGMVDGDGRPIFAQNATLQETTPFILGGYPLFFPMNGAWDSTRAMMLMADFNSLVYSIRRNLTFRVTRDGTFTDRNGQVHHLAQENKTVIIFHMRLGWEVLDPVTQMSQTPVPFAFLGAGAGPVTPTP